MANNPYIYVSSVVGENTGGSDTSQASQLTGAFSAMTAGDVYDNIGSAVAGCTPGDGDTIFVASNHAASYDNGASYDLSVNVPLNQLRIISVDSTDAEVYLPGATDELNDGVDDITLYGNGLIAGVSIWCGDNSNIFGTVTGRWTFQDATMQVTGSGDIGFGISQDGAQCILNNVDINTGDAAAFPFQLDNAGLLQWNGGSLTGTAISNMFGGVFGGSGGGIAEFTGVDLSNCTGTIMAATINNDHYMRVTLNNCKLNSGVTLRSDLESPNQRFAMFNCDDGTDFHRFYIADGSGSVNNNDATYVTATETWYEGSVKSSMEVITTAICNKINPFIFELPAQYVDLSQAASNVITLELTTDTALTLTDTDIAAFLCYPDGTTALQPNWVTSGKTVGTGNYGIDPLAAGTTLTTGSLGAGDWTGEPTSPNFYKMVLDTSGDAGQATAVSIRIEVYKASITAGKLFIHPLLTLS